jgi:hypothetical protein
MGPTVERVHNQLKVLFDHILIERTVAKRDLKYTVDVIPKALVLSELLQDCRNCSKGMLGPM